MTADCDFSEQVTHNLLGLWLWLGDGRCRITALRSWAYGERREACLITSYNCVY